MEKIWLILRREYLVRVQKKSFLLVTLLTPVAFAGLTFGAGFLAAKTSKVKTIQVIDESGLFAGKFKDTRDVKYVYASLGLNQAKQQLTSSDYQALLYVPRLDVDKPRGITLFADKNVSFTLQSGIERTLEGELENIKLERSGIDRKLLAQSKARVEVRTVALSEAGEQKSSVGAATAAGYLGAFLIYMSIFLYGAQVMRGVLEEKTSRIVEVIISSVKPFELMLGKILGVGLVGMTQFMIWVVLTVGLGSAATVLAFWGQLSANVQALNIPLIVTTFLFYFLGGYFLYGSLFAAVGAAADSETDTQQFMLPITIPLIASIVVAQVVLQDPDGSVAFWLSIFPLTSPIIMMVRVPFGVPTWQLLLSMGLLVVGFVGTTWVAARIYRVGILMYGKKVNFKELSKWLFYKA